MEYSDVNLYSITFSEPIYQEEDSIYSSTVQYEDGENEGDFYIKTSRLRVDEIQKVGNLTKITVEFLLSDPKFYEVVRSIDNYVVDEIVKNGDEWFGISPKYDTIENLFKKTVQLPDRLEKFPRMDIFVVGEVEVIDKNGDNVSIDNLKVNNEIVAVLQLRNIEFHINKYNLIYTVEKVEICNYFCQSSHYLFDDSDELDSMNDNSETNFVNSVEFC